MANIVLTRDYISGGRPAKILSISQPGPFPVVAVVTNPDGSMTTGFYTADGKAAPTGSVSNPGTVGILTTGPNDLVPALVAHTYWLNFYADGRTYRYDTQAAANLGTDLGRRIACVQVTFNEGDGL